MCCLRFWRAFSVQNYHFLARAFRFRRPSRQFLREESVLLGWAGRLGLGLASWITVCAFVVFRPTRVVQCFLVCLSTVECPYIIFHVSYIAGFVSSVSFLVFMQELSPVYTVYNGV